jgi:hypothetical protein
MRRCFSNLEPLTGGLEVLLDMHTVDAERHAVWTAPSQQLLVIEDSPELMLMLSEAPVSVWPGLSVSLVISVIG